MVFLFFVFLFSSSVVNAYSGTIPVGGGTDVEFFINEGPIRSGSVNTYFVMPFAVSLEDEYLLFSLFGTHPLYGWSILGSYYIPAAKGLNVLSFSGDDIAGQLFQAVLVSGYGSSPCYFIIPTEDITVEGCGTII